LLTPHPDASDWKLGESSTPTTLTCRAYADRVEAAFDKTLKQQQAAAKDAR